MAVVGEAASEEASEQALPYKICCNWNRACEVCELFWRHPDFFKVTLLNVILAAGFSLPRTYVIPPLQQNIWGDHAAANNNWCVFVASLLSVVFAPYFGRWSDRHSRRVANAILAIASNAPCLIMLALGQTELGLYVFIGIATILQPVALGPSGSPVCWAYVSDQLPEDLRVLGFSINQGASILGQFLFNQATKMLSDKFPQRPNIFLWVTAGLVILDILILLWMGQDKPRPREAITRDAQDSVTKTLWAPLKLLASNTFLCITCTVAALVTLPDVAAGASSALILYQLLGIEGPHHTAEQQAASTWAFVWPTLPFGLAFAISGVVSGRVGAARFIVVWLPFASIVFAAPVILLYSTASYMIFLQGFCTNLAYMCFPPLQAIAAQAVNPERVGEAMGTLSACKNFMCLIAPLVMGVATQMLSDIGRNDLFWTIYPACAVVMLSAWPFSIWMCMYKRDGQSHAPDLEHLTLSE